MTDLEQLHAQFRAAAEALTPTAAAIQVVPPSVDLSETSTRIRDAAEALKAAAQRGPPGPAGAQGDDGPIGPMPAHEWDGTKLRFEEPGGTWGEKVDLQGPPGERGRRGGGVQPAPKRVFGYFPCGW